jgi:aryl-alcohol dehydrogenase-like predicted oxidoreductase
MGPIVTHDAAKRQILSDAGRRRVARMEQRTLGPTGRKVSIVGLGAWQLGADWGEVSEEDAVGVLRAALDAGVTFVDTADVYGDGRSERVVGRVVRERGAEAPFVATKMGRRVEQRPELYTREHFLEWNERSRQNLGVETIDLVQLHCPPPAVYEDDAVFEALDELVERGHVAHYGVSVETEAEALAAIARPRVASVQIVLNLLRRKPLERVLPAAREAGVAIIARVPLASGLLSGRYDRDTTFAEDDHRSFNRHGEAFDVGETFAGVPFDVGLQAVDELREIVPEGVAMAQFALRWIVDQPGVTTVIPGARSPEQARGNVAAADLAPLTDEQLAAVEEVYDRHVREHVHDRW